MKKTTTTTLLRVVRERLRCKIYNNKLQCLLFSAVSCLFATIFITAYSLWPFRLAPSHSSPFSFSLVFSVFSLSYWLNNFFCLILQLYFSIILIVIVTMRTWMRSSTLLDGLFSKHLLMRLSDAFSQ